MTYTDLLLGGQCWCGVSTKHTHLFWPPLQIRSKSILQRGTWTFCYTHSTTRLTCVLGATRAP